MTSNIAQDLKLEAVDEQTVTQYLQQHPDLFDRHPQLLTRLRLQHPRNGTTVSLIERQVEVLREKHAALEQKLANSCAWRAPTMRSPTRSTALRGGSCAPRRTPRRSRKLRPDCVRTSTPITRCWCCRCRRTPRAHRPMRRPAASCARSSSDNPIFKSFESLFSNARPRCGQVRDTQRDFLFGSEAAAIGSVALIPLSAMSPPGLLALGSVDRDRFHPGMSVEFLSRLAELIADSLLHP